MSLPDELHELTVSAISALGLMINSAAYNVKKGKIPHPAGVDHGILPAIYIAPSRRPGRDEPFQTRQRWRDHGYDVAIITGSNRENLAGLPETQEARTQISDFFGKSDTRPFNRNEVVQYLIFPGPVVNRTAWLEANMDISTLTLVFGCVIDEGG